MSSKAYFNEVAQEWDKMRSEFFSNSLREKALEKAKVKTEQLAADIGAGTGFITELLEKKGLKVIAVDQSDSMVEIIKSRFTNTDARIGDSENLPINDNHVDYSFANMFLHHVENPSASIKEMVRILKPGGKLVITDLDKHEHEFLRIEHNDRWPGFERDNIKKWFKEAGLKNISVDCLGEDCSATSEASEEQADISIFIAYGEK